MNEPRENNEMPAAQAPQQAEAPAPTSAEQNSGAPAGEEQKFGPLIGIVVIIAAIALGGYYLWNAELADRILPQDSVSAEDIRNQEDPALESLQSQDSSDELSSIEADLEATQFGSFDSDLQEIDEELGS